MHLTIISPFPPAITGIGQYGYHVSRMLARSGLFSKITVLTEVGEGSERLSMPQPIEIRPSWHHNHPEILFEIVAEVERLEPDLVWFNLGASAFGPSPLANVSGFLAPSFVHRLGVPTVVMLHEMVELADLKALNAPGGPLAAFGAHLLTWFARQGDVLCLTMHHYVDWLTSRNPDIHCVHIPIGAYRPPEMLEETENPELLFFTTLAPYKGLENLLEAYRRLLPAYPNLQLTIAGAEHPRFPGYAQTLRAANHDLSGIRWLGQVPENGVQELFRRAQIVVVPYTASTGSSSVLLQSATWGRPVVASDLDEIKTQAKESGFSVEYFHRGDAESLYQALLNQLASPEKRKEQVRKNFAVVQRTRPEDTCRAFLGAFNLAFESSASPRHIDIPNRLTTGTI